MWGMNPIRLAGFCSQALAERSVPGLVGFIGTAHTTLPRATSSWRSCRRFGISSLERRLTPVTLPSGRLRLATTPPKTGSSTNMKTIGIVAIARLSHRSPARDNNDFDLVFDQVFRRSGTGF